MHALKIVQGRQWQWQVKLSGSIDKEKLNWLLTIGKYDKSEAGKLAHCQIIGYLNFKDLSLIFSFMKNILCCAQEMATTNAVTRFGHLANTLGKHMA